MNPSCNRTILGARTRPALSIRKGRLRGGRGLCSSPEAISRAAGADILAQLGVSKGVAEYPFADESVPILVSLLADTEPDVVSSALYALGHVAGGKPARLARLANHSSENVREALAYALGGRTDSISTGTIILSRDQDVDTRDWRRLPLVRCRKRTQRPFATHSPHGSRIATMRFAEKLWRGSPGVWTSVLSSRSSGS